MISKMQLVRSLHTDQSYLDTCHSRVVSHSPSNSLSIPEQLGTLSECYEEILQGRLPAGKIDSLCSLLPSDYVGRSSKSPCPIKLIWTEFGEAWLGRRPDTAKVEGSNPSRPTNHQLSVYRNYLVLGKYSGLRYSFLRVR